MFRGVRNNEIRTIRVKMESQNEIRDIIYFTLLEIVLGLCTIYKNEREGEKNSNRAPFQSLTLCSPMREEKSSFLHISLCVGKHKYQMYRGVKEKRHKSPASNSSLYIITFVNILR